uniref:Peptidase C1A papain C-terminal domain-containing protein n=1 Tax=viral metagenome TaxID=1070528 RepID=A0A6C0BJ07_9ZZZZ
MHWIITLYLICECLCLAHRSRWEEMSDEEFQTNYLINLTPHIPPFSTSPQFKDPPIVVIPAEMDWRRANVVTNIKDQLSCGSCWIFSTIEVIESRVAINGGDLMELSTQQLVDCAGKGCDGGTVPYAVTYLKTHGSCSANYFYVGHNNTCHNCSRVVNVTGYTYYRGEVPMLQAIQHGPLAVYLDSSKFKNYGPGIIDTTMNCTTATNHAVVLVGYGITSNGVKYWIARNSWGSDWGENGYFRIQRGINLCGIEAYAYSIDAYQVGTDIDYLKIIGYLVAGVLLVALVIILLFECIVEYWYDGDCLCCCHKCSEEDDVIEVELENGVNRTKTGPPPNTK